MIYEGKAITVKALESGIVELKFDLKGESVNKFNRLTLNELRQAVDTIKADASVKGVIVSSGKDVFIVGADITELVDNFKLPDAELVAGNLEANKIFSDFEDLNVPTVAAINGIALGGGLEMCLAADFRVMSVTAKIGLPEVKLGIYPGFGGTVRLPRIIGADNAIEWIAAGKENKAEDALKVGAVDAVVAPDKLAEAALNLIKGAISGEFDYKAKRQPKLEKLKLNAIEQMMSFETAKGFVAGQAGPNYPAPVEAIKTIQKAANFGRDKALEVEAAGFVKLAKTSAAQSLIGLFLNDQELKKKAKAYDEIARDVKQAAVLGAGIMGGGIAYQSASKGTPILMKDINEHGIEQGLAEAAKLLVGRVYKGRMTAAKMAEVLNGIRPTLSYGDFGHVDLVVEAVVENPKVKQAVLAEVEAQVKEDTILASNTSTISISLLAKALKRPENFVGMHFFNPVHMMPLVEVIRGEKSSELAVATTVAYAKKMGKNPIVVNDCPGFLVNRVLFPYFGGFATPTADSRPAMVVGIRQTSSEINTVIETGVPAWATATPNSEKGSNVTVTPRNTMVSATSRMERAISFGVFCRLAFSTMAIMRSTKVSPGLVVTRTTIQSESTRVPPVTAEKSPPHSRITGADSSVIADSSTEAAPSITSPSAGMIESPRSPASTTTTSPLHRPLDCANCHSAP